MTTARPDIAWKKHACLMWRLCDMSRLECNILSYFNQENIKNRHKARRMTSTGFFFCPCVYTPCALRALVRPPMAVYGYFAVRLACLPCAAGILSRLALYNGNMTTFTSGVNIHMSIHFIMVTRQHDSMIKPIGLVGWFSAATLFRARVNYVTFVFCRHIPINIVGLWRQLDLSSSPHVTRANRFAAIALTLRLARFSPARCI